MNKVEINLDDNGIMQKTKIGDLYLIDNDVYILAFIQNNEYGLIDLSTGTTWYYVFKCKDENMTVENITNIIKKNDDLCNETIVRYLGNKTIVIKEN